MVFSPPTVVFLSQLMRPISNLTRKFSFLIALSLFSNAALPAFALRVSQLEKDSARVRLQAALEEKNTATGLEELPRHPFLVSVEEREARVRQLAVLARDKRQGTALGFTPEQVDRLNQFRRFTYDDTVQWPLDDGTTQEVDVVRANDLSRPGWPPGKGGERAVLQPYVLGEVFMQTWNDYLTRVNPTPTQAKRFLKKLTRQMAQALARLMSWKLAMVNLHKELVGAKGEYMALNVISQLEKIQILSWKEKFSSGELERLNIAIGQALGRAGVIGPDEDIPAPDLGTNSLTMRQMLEGYFRSQVENPDSSFCQEYPDLAKHLRPMLNSSGPGTPFYDFIWAAAKSGRAVRHLAAFTGKPLEMGGSELREEATGFGGMVVAQETARRVFPDLKESENPLKDLIVAVQGFGKVGTSAALFFCQAGAVVQEVSDISGSLKKQEGFTEEELKTMANWIRQGYQLKDYEKMALEGAQFIKDPSELLRSKVDILVLAAMELGITEENAREIRARLILSLANGAVTSQASGQLHKQGTETVSESVGSVAGVIVSYFEKVQNEEGTHWDRKKVETALTQRLSRAVEDLWTMWEWLKKNVDPDVDLMTAGDVLSVGRLVKTYAQAGLEEDLIRDAERLAQESLKNFQQFHRQDLWRLEELKGNEGLVQESGDIRIRLGPLEYAVQTSLPDAVRSLEEGNVRSAATALHRAVYSVEFHQNRIRTIAEMGKTADANGEAPRYEVFGVPIDVGILESRFHIHPWEGGPYLEWLESMKKELEAILHQIGPAAPEIVKVAEEENTGTDSAASPELPKTSPGEPRRIESVNHLPGPLSREFVDAKIRHRFTVLPRSGLEEKALKQRLKLLEEGQVGRRRILLIPDSVLQATAGLEEFLAHLPEPLARGVVLDGDSPQVRRLRERNSALKVFLGTDQMDLAVYLAGLEEADRIGVLVDAALAVGLESSLSSLGIHVTVIPKVDVTKMLAFLGTPAEVSDQVGLEELLGELSAERGA